MLSSLTMRRGRHADCMDPTDFQLAKCTPISALNIQSLCHQLSKLSSLMLASCSEMNRAAVKSPFDRHWQTVFHFWSWPLQAWQKSPKPL